MYKKFCDFCTKQVYKTYRCSDCGSSSDIIYHKSCLKKINQSLYCPKHSEAHIENGLIIKYLKSTWQRLNIGGELSVRGLLDASNWSEVSIKFPGRTYTFKGTWSSHSHTILLKSNNVKEPVIHRVRLHSHNEFRTALKAMLAETVAKSIADSEKSIKLHEREVREIKRLVKNERFLSDIFAGKAKWPKPKPVIVLKEIKAIIPDQDTVVIGDPA